MNYTHLELSTPALLFPAISLLLLAYTNRFLSLAQIIRQLSTQLHTSKDLNIQRQIKNLHIRINLIKAMQAFGVLSITFCVIVMFLIFAGYPFAGAILFGFSLGTMVLSLIISLWEILLSGIALKIELEKWKERSEV